MADIIPLHNEYLLENGAWNYLQTHQCSWRLIITGIRMWPQTSFHTFQIVFCFSYEGQFPEPNLFLRRSFMSIQRVSYIFLGLFIGRVETITRVFISCGASSLYMLSIFCKLHYKWLAAGLCRWGSSVWRGLTCSCLFPFVLSGDSFQDSPRSRTPQLRLPVIHALLFFQVCVSTGAFCHSVFMTSSLFI